MLLSSWSLKLSYNPLLNLAAPLKLDQNAFIYQSVGKKLFVQKNNQSIALPIQKQICALQIIQNPKSDIVVTLSNNNLSAYDILENHQNFYVEFELADIMHINSSNIYVAGGSDLYCLDLAGKQKYNNHLPSNILCINSLLQYCMLALDDKSIKIYSDLALLYDYSNLPNVPKCICPISKNTVAVGFIDGMTAVYQTKKSKWKAKSKLIPVKMLMVQIEAMKEKTLIVARQEGQVELRNWIDGTTLSKISLQQQFCQLYLYDFRKQNNLQLIYISKEGNLKAFNLVEKTEKQTNLIGQERQQQYQELQQLINRKKLLEAEISDIKKLSSEDASQNKQILRPDFQISFSFLNKNKLVLIASAKNGFIKGIVFQEALCPLFVKPTEKLVYEFEKSCNFVGQLNLKVYVSSFPTNQYETRQMTINLPKFWRWSYCVTQGDIKESQTFISFIVRQRIARFVKWVNQCFLLGVPQDELNKWQEKTNLKLAFFNSYQNIYLRLSVDSQTSLVQIRTDSLTVMGDMIQDLAQYMNLKDLESEGKFPIQMETLKEKLKKIEQINKNKTSISSQIAEAINSVKYMIVKGENSRVTTNMKEMRKIYTQIMEENHKLFVQMKKKSQNAVLLNELLKDLAQMISKTSNLRLGAARTRTTNLCRNALKNKQFLQLLNIMEKGRE